MKTASTPLLAALALLPAMLPAAPVSWSVSSVTGPADVSTRGRLIGAMNVGGTTAQTISGVNFEADVSPSSADTFTFGTGAVQFGFAGGGDFDAWAGGDPGGDAAYGAGLDSARWNDSMTVGSIMLINLTPGRQYLVQLWIVDSRPGLGGRVRTVDGVSTTAGGTNIATGIFTADAATQSISIAGVSGSHGPQLNLLQLRDLSPIVVTSAGDSGPGSLRQALADTAASSGPNTILFSPALSGQTINVASSLAITHSGELILDATALPGVLTISDGGVPQSRNLLTISSASSVVIRGITLKDGGTDWLAEQVHGGAIRNEGTLTATACSFTGNRGADGGAVYNSGTLTLLQCAFDSNSASDGGAVYNTGTLTATCCTFSSNTTTGFGAGGAICNDLHADNQATITLTNCTLTNNRAYSGGALHMPSGRLTHCTLAFNATRDGGGGGGIFLSSLSRLTLENSIVAGNTAPPAPGSSLPTGPDILSLTGSILTYRGTNIVQNGVTPFLGGGGTTEGPGTALLLDPKVSAPGDHGGGTRTCRLLPGSPALDAAGPVTGVATDQRGFHRSRNGDATAGAAPDIGAFEAQNPPATGEPSVIVITTASDELDPPNVPGAGVSLREALAYPLSSMDVVFDPAVFNGEPADVVVTAPDKGEFVPRSSTALRISGAGAKVTISGNGGGSGRLLFVPPGSTVTLEELRLTQGGGAGPVRPGFGGAVLNEGTLNINRCTLDGNSAQYGGGIHSSGTLDLVNCTLTNNLATNGAAVSHEGSLQVTHCTVYGNTAPGSAGGLLALVPSATTTLSYSILAGNSAPANGADLLNIGTLTRLGSNLVQSHLNIFGGTDSGPPALVAAPLLAPPGDYGGSAFTLPPLPGSPAINAAPGSATTVDQRGLPRPQGDSEAPGNVIPDLGSVEFQEVLVTTLADENDTPAGTATSLREALRDDASGAVPADLVSFAPSLSGGTIGLSNPGGGASAISVNASVAVDGAGLPGGIKLSAAGASGHRLLEVSPGVRLTLRRLTLTGAGSFGLAEGGAVRVRPGATLTMERCTLSGNRAYLGGAVSNHGTLTVSQCTLAGNAAFEYAAAIDNLGTLLAVHTTMAANTLNFPGGTIRNSGSLTLSQCIVAGTGPLSGPEIYNEGSLIRQGANIVPSLSNILSGSDQGPAAITAAPLLAPLGDYGGPTAVMTLLPGSPARDAAGSTIASDQRDFPVVGIPDLGSCEAGNLGNCPAWLWETLPADAGEAERAPGFDFDGDGQSNESEWTTLTNPGDPSSWFSLTYSGSGANQQITFPTATGRTYTLWSSENLGPGSWAPSAHVSPVTGDGSQKSFVLPQGPEARKFFRVLAAP